MATVAMRIQTLFNKSEFILSACKPRRAKRMHACMQYTRCSNNYNNQEKAKTFIFLDVATYGSYIATCAYN